ncbi:MAG: VWA domain-containing protein [Kamptonema sp. SIO1D9]|nr:VWA domain-containing protein [Kamptonema sp. SIO1D9]
MKGLNYVDICFVVDTTGSMSSFIQVAQQQLLKAINTLSTDNNINLQVGLVEYRDHPPQDTSFVTRIYPLTDNLHKMQNHIRQLRADGGGDGAEAVYRGVEDACQQMRWRKHSCRFAILVGDAPPHGFAAWMQTNRGVKLGKGSDSWHDGCPSGLDVQLVTATAEDKQVKVYSLCMVRDRLTNEAFNAIATLTGGECVPADNANIVITQIQSILKNEFSNVTFDRQVLQTIQQFGQPDVTEIAQILDSPRLPVAASVARLGKRGFLEKLVQI